MSYDVEVEGLEEFIRAISDVEDLSGDMQRVFYNAMSAALSALEEQISGRTPINTGLLRGSYYQEIRGERAQMVGTLGTPLNYAMPVEYGRRAKMPPVAPIQAWVRRKLGVADDKASRSIAWALAVHMSKHDRPGVFMFRDGIEAAKPHLEQIFSQLLRDTVDHLGGKSA